MAKNGAIKKLPGFYIINAEKKESLIWRGIVGFWFLSLVAGGIELSMIEKLKTSVWGSPATLTIIVINIVFYIALNTVPNLADKLLLDPDLILERPWTLVTVFFSQEWFIHILGNMGLLFIFGRQLEKITSS